jgi:hypothetical protein
MALHPGTPLLYLRYIIYEQPLIGPKMIITIKKKSIFDFGARKEYSQGRIIKVSHNRRGRG